jgi:hypothetical protein
MSWKLKGGLIGALALGTWAASLGQEPSTVTSDTSSLVPAVELLGTWSLPGDASDQSGLSGTVENGTPLNRLGGISAIDFDSATGTYWAASDRGPSDGAVSWPCRIHQLKIEVTQDGLKGEIIKTVMLRDRSGNLLSGKADQIGEGEGATRRFDPEGIRIVDDTFYISDEYGPSIIHFDNDGKAIAEVEVPASFHIARKSGDENLELSQNQAGRVTNRGLECLAIFGTEHRLCSLMQSPLIQDSEKLSNGKFSGLNCRLEVYDSTEHPVQQLVYHLDDANNKLNEILAIDDHRFLVIERDGKAGTESQFKKIMQIDLENASEVASVEKLPANDLPGSIRPVAKSEFIDLLDDQFHLAGDKFPEKVEGLCWGPDLADGRKVLMVAVDNDFIAENDNLFYAFAVSPEALKAAPPRIVGK